MELRLICDSVLYAYLSKVADIAEKRHYLHVLCTAVGGNHWCLPLTYVDTFLDFLNQFKILDLRLSFFEPYDLRVLLAIMTSWSPLSHYFMAFRLDPERSREFHYEEGLWCAFVATRYMRFLRTWSDSR